MGLLLGLLVPAVPAHAFQLDRKPSMLVSKMQQRIPIAGCRQIGLDKERLGAVKQAASRGAFILEDLPLADGRLVDVSLERVSVFAENARIRVMHGGDDVDKGIASYTIEELEVPEILVLGGTIEGDPDSVVFLSIDGNNVIGLIRTAATTQIISSGEPGDPKDSVIYDVNAVPIDAIEVSVDQCGMDEFVKEPEPRRYPELDEGGLASGIFHCKQIKLALDVDYDLFSNKFDHDLWSSLVYITQLVAAQNVVYKRDVGFEFLISEYTIWTTPEDPWTGPDEDEELSPRTQQLNEYRDWYQANGALLDYDIAHLLTSRLGGGQASGIGMLCTGDAFAISCEIDGSFPYPIDNLNRANWDVNVFMHENGHLCGATHTHNYCPPIDQCAGELKWGPCQEETICQTGTVMSYCQSCTGGMGNIYLGFHPETIDRMREHVGSASCVDEIFGTLSPLDDFASTWQDSPVAIDVTRNDVTTCDDPVLVWVQPTTSNGGTVEIVDNTWEFGRPHALYTPASGFTGIDTFSYIVNAGFSVPSESAVVEVTVQPQVIEADLLVADRHQDAVYRFRRETGEYLGVLVQPGSGGLEDPTGIAIGPGGDIFLACGDTNRVLRYNGMSGEFLGVFFDAADFGALIDIEIDQLHVYLLFTSGFGSSKVGKIDLNTSTLTDEFPLGMGSPYDLSLGRDDGSLVVSGYFGGGKVQVHDNVTGELIGSFFTWVHQIATPICTARTRSGQLAVLDGSTGYVGLFDGDSLEFLYGYVASEWIESQSIESPKQLLFDPDDGDNFYLHEAGIHSFDNMMGDHQHLITLGVEHLTSPACMVLREAPEWEPADLDFDGRVDGMDLAILLGQFGAPGSADINGDGIVDGGDLAEILGRWSN